MRDLGDVLAGTTEASSYDATRIGPMCEQGKRSPDSVENVNNLNINDIVEKLLQVWYFYISHENLFSDTYQEYV